MESNPSNKGLSSDPTKTPSSERKPQNPSATTSRYERDAWYGEYYDGEFTEDDFSFFDRPESTSVGKDNRAVQSGRNTSRGRSNSPKASSSSHYRGPSGGSAVDLVDAFARETFEGFPLYDQHASADWGTPFGLFADSHASTLSNSPEAAPASLDTFPQTLNNSAGLENGPQTEQGTCQVADNEFKYVSRASTSTDEKPITASLGVSYPETNETSTFETFDASPASSQVQPSRSQQAALSSTRAALTTPSQPTNPHDSHQSYLPQNLSSPPLNCPPEPKRRGKSLAQFPSPEPAAAKPSRGKAGARKRKRAAKGSAASHVSQVSGPATPARPSERGPQCPAVTPINTVVRKKCQFQHLDGVHKKQCLDVLPEDPQDIRAHLQRHYKALAYKNVNSYVPCPFCEDERSLGGLVKKDEYRFGDLSKHIVDHHLKARQWRCPCGGIIGRYTESFQRKRHLETGMHIRYLAQKAAEEEERYLAKKAAEEEEEESDDESDDERDEGSSSGVKRRRLN